MAHLLGSSLNSLSFLPFLPPVFLPQPDLESQREDGLANIRQCLAESRAGLGLLGCEVERGRYSEHNTRVQPVARDSDELALTDVSTKPRFVIGNDVSVCIIMYS